MESLFDAAAADNAVASGLVARGNAVIASLQQKGRAEGRTEGRAEGTAEAILRVLAARGLPASEALRHRILGTTDLDQLQQWLQQAVVVTVADEIVT